MERAADNPWPEWPKVYKLDYGQEEAAARFGDDPRVYLTTARNSSATRTATSKNCTPSRSNGRKNDKGAVRAQAEFPAPSKVLPAQLVLLAMGFLGPEQPVLEQLGVERDARSNVKAEYGKYATNVPGVFAAGDCRRGQSLVVWAINEGRGAARECDRYLMGDDEFAVARRGHNRKTHLTTKNATAAKWRGLTTRHARNDVQKVQIV